ncbi:MAG: hypothetical protein AABX89_07410 [Candidatus Thermoplasmatota archaeon]
MKVSLPHKTLLALALGAVVYISFRRSWLFGFLALPLAVIAFLAIQFGAQLIGIAVKAGTLPARSAIGATKLVRRKR